MISVVDSYSISESVRQEFRTKAMEWAKKATKYIRTKWPEIDLQLLINRDGQKSDIHFVGKHESITTYEDFLEPYWSDEGIRALVDELAEMEKAADNTVLFINRRLHTYDIVDLE